MSYRFQKWYYTILFLLFLACAKDYDFEITTYTQENLKMLTETGLKFENSNIQDGTKFNIKTNSNGKVSVEILDLTNTLVSRNTLEVNEGDNVYTVYTRALSTGDYTFRFLDVNGNEIEKLKLFVQ